ncbi:carbohydrate sulfotransferase 10-like [Amphiura filiformis]|uniref:carbohydrate sulfotransferase 10-like n=1 Tax=Amphiura filiformis TaxID=82378 RepID=UPI003B217C60
MVTVTRFKSVGNIRRLKVFFTLLILIMLMGLLFLSYYPGSAGVTKYYIRPTEKSTRYHAISHMDPQLQGQQFCDEECQWLQLQSRRRETLLQACAAYNETSPNNLKQWLMDHLHVVLFLWVSDKHKALYCNVPKVASSNWKKVFYILNKGEAPYNQSFISNVMSMNQHIHDWRPTRMSPDDVIHRLKTYTKFIIVREPFTRALSAYRDKFEDNQNKRLWQHWMYNMYLHVTNQSTWPEFVQFVSHTNAKFKYQWFYGGHWQPINELCLPCQINYDIIGKLKTMDTDAKFILKKLGAPELESVVSTTAGHETNSSNADTQHTYMNELSVGDVNLLEQKYEKDFKLFGYSRFTQQTQKLRPTEKSTRYQHISHMDPQRQGQQFCDEECQWLQLQSRRRETLHQACAAYNETSPNNLKQWLMDHINVLMFLWVSDKHKALYCNVPKAASSNWKKVFYILNKGEAPYNQSFISNLDSGIIQF